VLVCARTFSTLHLIDDPISAWNQKPRLVF
jgi:hypothetical protein